MIFHSYVSLPEGSCIVIVVRYYNFLQELGHSGRSWQIYIPKDIPVPGITMTPPCQAKGFPDGARFEAIAAPFDENFVVTWRQPRGWCEIGGFKVKNGNSTDE